MALRSRKYLAQQLQIVLDELNGPRPITAEFLRVHVDTINEQARALIATLPHSDHPRGGYVDAA